MCGDRAENMMFNTLKKLYPNKFKGFNRVLEFGSCNINGSFKHNIKRNEYVGVDVASGIDVDVVSVAHEFKDKEGFDFVYCTSMLEHDMYWIKTIRNMIKLLKPDGLMFISCCYKYDEHGTKKTTPEQSLTSQMDKEWANYYKNLSPDEVSSAINFDKFKSYYIGENPYSDAITVFWGVKK